MGRIFLSRLFLYQIDRTYHMSLHNFKRRRVPLLFVLLLFFILFLFSAPDYLEASGSSTRTQKIRVAESFVKTYGDPDFSMAATVSSGNRLVYRSSNKEVVTVDKKGTVSIVGAGIAYITVRAAAGDGYRSVKKKVKITIRRRKLSGCNFYLSRIGKLVRKNLESSCILSDGDSILEKGRDYAILAISCTEAVSGAITDIQIEYTGRGNYAGTLVCTADPILSTSRIFSVKSLSSGIQVTWRKEKAALGYEIFRRQSNGKFIKVTTVDDPAKTSWTDTSVGSATPSFYQVRAYTFDADRNILYANPSRTLGYTPSVVLDKTSVAVRNTEKGIRIFWKRVEGASGYYVYRNGKKIKTIKDAGSDTRMNWTDQTIANGGVYSYRVYAYHGKYQSSSSVRKRLCYLSPPKKVTLKIKSHNRFLIRWKTNSKADGYEVQYSTDPSFTRNVVSRIVTDTGSVSLRTLNCESGKVYYARVRSYKALTEKTCYSEWTVSKGIRMN